MRRRWRLSSRLFRPRRLPARATTKSRCQWWIADDFVLPHISILSKSSTMKIDRRGFLVASSSALVLGKSKLSPAAFEQPSETPEPPEIGRRIEARDVAVYTTADKTNYRLSATDTLTFKPMGQPLETQVCVFVDPSKRSQT